MTSLITRSMAPRLTTRSKLVAAIAVRSLRARPIQPRRMPLANRCFTSTNPASAEQTPPSSDPHQRFETTPTSPLHNLFFILAANTLIGTLVGGGLGWLDARPGKIALQKAIAGLEEQKNAIEEAKNKYEKLCEEKNAQTNKSEKDDSEEKLKDDVTFWLDVVYAATCCASQIGRSEGHDADETAEKLMNHAAEAGAVVEKKIKELIARKQSYQSLIEKELKDLIALYKE